MEILSNAESDVRRILGVYIFEMYSLIQMYVLTAFICSVLLCFAAALVE